MKDQSGIREQAEAVLELSNAILTVAIEGRREKIDSLMNRRADLIERMFSVGEASGDNRIFLAGVMEYVRTMDAMTRECLDWDRQGGWAAEADGESELDWFEEEDAAFLNPDTSEGELTELMRCSAL
jgi:hypothetical protein